VRQNRAVRPFLVCGLLASALLTSCGNSRTAPPDVSAPQQPKGVHPVSYPTAGIALTVPDNWRAEAGTNPLVTSVASGTATVAVWRYKRSEPLPASARAFRTAQRALVRAAQGRDKTLRIATAKVVRFHGRPALELVGTETVGGQRRMVRSTHVFRERSEVVLEALAPPDAFAALEPTVFAPVLRSLKIRPLPR
jgi:hypothetical protein